MTLVPPQEWHLYVLGCINKMESISTWVPPQDGVSMHYGAATSMHFGAATSMHYGAATRWHQYALWCRPQDGINIY